MEPTIIYGIYIVYWYKITSVDETLLHSCFLEIWYDIQ